MTHSAKGGSDLTLWTLDDKAMRAWLGSGMVLISVLLIALAVALKSQTEGGFSFTTDYMSHLGAVGFEDNATTQQQWVSQLFNSALLFLGPLRFGFILLVLLGLDRGRRNPSQMFLLGTVGLVLSVASAGVGLVPYTISTTAHYVLAGLTYGGWGLLAVSFAIVEVKAGRHWLLPLTGLVSAGMGLLFFYGYFLAGGSMLAISGEYAIWEWLSFLFLQFWLLSHAWCLND